MSDQEKNNQVEMAESSATDEFVEVKKPEPAPEPQKTEPTPADRYLVNEKGEFDPEVAKQRYNDLYGKLHGDIAGLKGSFGEVNEKLSSFEQKVSKLDTFEEKFDQILQNLNKPADDIIEEATAEVEQSSPESSAETNWLKVYDKDYDPDKAYQLFNQELERKLSEMAKPNLDQNVLLEAIEKSPEIANTLAEKLYPTFKEKLQKEESEQRANREIQELVDAGHDEAEIYAAIGWGMKKGAETPKEAWESYHKYLQESFKQNAEKQAESELARQIEARKEIPRNIEGSLADFPETNISPFDAVLKEAETNNLLT